MPQYDLQNILEELNEIQNKNKVAEMRLQEALEELKQHFPSLAAAKKALAAKQNKLNKLRADLEADIEEFLHDYNAITETE